MQRKRGTQKNAGLPEKILGRSLPFSVEAEKAVLGSLLLHDGYLDGVAEVLKHEDFYSPAHQTIFKTMLEIAGNRERLDIITLQNSLEKGDLLSEIGGTSYLLSLQEDISAVGLINQHTNIIKEKIC